MTELYTLGATLRFAPRMLSAPRRFVVMTAVTLMMTTGCATQTSPALTSREPTAAASIATPVASQPVPTVSSVVALPSPASCPAPKIAPGPSPSTAPEPSPPAGLVRASILFPPVPETVATGFGSVWVAAHRNNKIFRIDPATNKVVTSIPIDPAYGVGAVFVGPHGVWVPPFHINPVDNSIDLKLSLRGQVADSSDSVWIWNDPQDGSRRTLVEIDPTSGSVQRSVDLGSVPGVPQYTPELAYGAGSLWAVVANNEVARFDPATDSPIATITTPSVPLAYGTFAFADKHVYFVEKDSTLARIDPTTNCVDGVAYLGSELAAPLFGAPLGAVAAAPDGLYVGFDVGALALVDPVTLHIKSSVRIDVQNATGALTYGFSSIWFPTFGNNTVLRLKPLE